MLTCLHCGAGPFIENGKPRVMHWYDYAHVKYQVDDLPNDTPEGDWDSPASWWFDQQQRELAQKIFDLAEPT